MSNFSQTGKRGAVLATPSKVSACGGCASGCGSCPEGFKQELGIDQGHGCIPVGGGH